MSCHSRHVNNVSLWFIVFSLTRTRHCLMLTSKFMVTRSKKLIITRLYKNTTVWFCGVFSLAMITMLWFPHIFTTSLHLHWWLACAWGNTRSGLGAELFTSSLGQGPCVTDRTSRWCTPVHATVHTALLASLLWSVGKWLAFLHWGPKISSHSQWTLYYSLDWILDI